MAFNKVLIAVEGSPIAAHAVDVGVQLARSLKAEIALIRVTAAVHTWRQTVGF